MITMNGDAFEPFLDDTTCTILAIPENNRLTASTLARKHIANNGNAEL
jgi:hypothetical protein